MSYSIENFYIWNNQLFNKAKAGDIDSIFGLYRLLIAEAFELMPTNAPGAEDRYPPMCSLLAHEFLKEAERALLPLAENGNVRAQLNLVELYYNGFETPRMDKIKYWSAIISKVPNNIQQLKKIKLRQFVYRSQKS